MRKLAGCVCVLLLAGPSRAALAISGDSSVPAGAMARLTASGAAEGAAILWEVRPDPSDEEESGPKLVFTGEAGRTYRVRCRAVKGGAVESARARVTFGAPAPPAPPGPTPPPGPGPADPLALGLQALYSADATPTKAKDLASLAALYRQAVAAASDPALKTAADLSATLKRASGSLLPPGSLAALRVRLGSELAAVLPTRPGDALTPDVRAQAAAAFQRIAAALDKVVP